MMEMTVSVMNAAPIGVFCMIAKTFATIGFDAFVPMLKYMGCVLLALAIQALIIYQILIFLSFKSISSQVNAKTSPVLIPVKKVVKNAQVKVLFFLNLVNIFSISSVE